MDFFEQLQVFSERFFDQLKIEERESPWGPDEYSGNEPQGAILHFTADNDLERVVKWFMREEYGAKASANVVIADRVYASTTDLMDGLPLVKELPVTVVQCRPPEAPTYHATWASYHCYGIELLNVGELREREDVGLVSHWKRDKSSAPWTTPWSHPLKQAHQGWQRLWEPYTAEQVGACIAVLRHLRNVFPRLDPSWIVGHENVQGRETPSSGGKDKRDPGPLLPVRHIRESVVSDPWDATWLKAYEADHDFCAKDRSLTVQLWARYRRQQQEYETLRGIGDREEAREFQEKMAVTRDDLPSASVSWIRFTSAFQAMVNDPHAKFSAVGKTALRVLGYHVPVIHDDINDHDRKALWLFQKLMGLKTDHVPGPKTRQALRERMVDRGIL